MHYFDTLRASRLTRRMSRGTAAALALLALSAGAHAQTLPINAAAIHHHSIAARPTTSGPKILSGQSVVTPPRSGGLAAGLARLNAHAARPNANAAPPVAGWMSVGPDSIQNAAGTVGGNPDAVSGRVAALAVDPLTDSTFYVASAGGGVWKTTDGGNSYVATTDFLGDTAMGSIAVAPSNGSIIYAGTGEANNSGDSRYGNGLLKSTDGAATWSVIPGPSGVFVRRYISKVVVNPTNPSIVYLALSGGGNDGVWKSTDGGSTWTNTTAAAGLDTGQPYSDLVLDPTNPNTLYTAIGDIFGAGSNGIYKTTDGGNTWTELTAGLPTANVGRISLTLAASASSTLYASISSSGSPFGSLLGLYKTTNGGSNWTKLTAAPNYLGGQGWYDDAVVVSPTNPNQIFAGGQVNYGGGPGSYYALAGSQDGGATFQDYSIGVGNNGPHTDLHALTFTADGATLLDGNDGGVWRLENPSAAGSASTTQWTDLNANLGTIQFTGIALHPTDPTIAYGGSQDNGTEKYTGDVAWTQLLGGDGGFVRVDQTTPQTVYHEYYGISLERSDDGGATWNGKTTGINPTDPQPPDGSDPAAFYVPFKLDPANQQRVIYATNHVYESTNKGDNFTAIGTPGTAGFNPGGNVLSTLGVNGSTIYAAAGGNVYATFNDGATWSNVSLPGNAGSITDIFVNPTNAQDVYVARGAFGTGKIFHSTNGGTNWTDISGNLPDEPFNAILLNPATGALYAGGDDGVYASTDGGSTWPRLDPAGNFPTVQVVDLALSPGANLLGAGTHGRGLFEIGLSDAPFNLTATAQFTQILLNWKAFAPPGATYNVYRGTTPGGEAATPIATGVTAKTYADTAIIPDTTYYYKVATVVGSNVSAFSNEASAVAPHVYNVPTDFTTIQAAITAAPAGSIVQVANGTYSGPGNVDLDMGGKNLLVRSVNGAAKTFIECGGTASAAHRAFHFQSGETTATVQGFTFQHANGPDEGAVHVELNSQATILGCVFANNTSSGSGAGIYVDGTATLVGCAFTGNAAQGGYAGGAALYSNGTFTATNCTFVGNQSGNYGGALDVNDGVGVAANCLFTGNTATTGSVINNFGTLSLINCSATQNAASGSLAIYSGGTANLINDILWNDAGGELDPANTAGAAASHCDVMGGYPGAGDFSTDPKFVSPPADLHLQPGSPCLGAGTANGATTTDLDGRTRPSPPSVGAYEAAAIAPTNMAVASVSGSTGQTVSLKATLTSGGTGVASKTVSFTVDGVAAGSAVTNTSGVAALPYAIPAGDAPGSHPVTATFAGDGSFQGATGNGTLSVTRIVTAMTVPPVTGSVGQTITVKATLTRSDTGAGVAGETITFTQDGTSVGTGVTNASGVATHSYVIAKGTSGGDHPLNGVFAGDNTFAPVTGTGTLTVPKIATTLGVRNATGAPGARITLFAQLARTDTGAGVTGKTITFKIDGTAVGTGVTDSTGVASLVYPLPAGTMPGSHPLAVSFAGDVSYVTAAGTGTLTVSKVVPALAGQAESGSVGQPITLAARLSRPDTGAVLPGKTLTFTVDGVAVGSSVTAANGYATLTYVIPDTATVGSHPIVASFAGDSVDNPASGTSTLTVSKASTRIAVAHVSGRRGTSVMLTATLTRSTDKGVLAGETVTFSVDGTSVGTGTTDSTGVAQVSYAIDPAASVGSHTVTVTFAGDAFQNAGTGSGTLSVN